MSKAPVLLSFLSVVALVACSSSGDDDIGPGDALASAQVAGLCDRACVKVLECEPTQTEAECIGDCSPFGTIYRGDLFVDLIECLEAKTCAELDNGSGCDGVFDAVVPTATAEAFLAAMRAAETRCAATPFNQSSSDDVWILLNDPLLTALTACTDDPCDQVDACIDGALDLP
ncbi:MAG: hypothetical protein IPL61_00880 [Myxococcales bacterium]|nr:hypothetical protein [Myxococcales bacterium]